MTARPRLVLAFLLGFVCFFVLPLHGSLAGRALTCWNLAIWAYLAMVWWLMIRAQPAQIRRIAKAQDENAEIVLALVCVGCLVSLATILVELASAKGTSGIHQLAHISFTGITLVGAWLMLPTSFAIHYAHLFYTAADGPCKPLLFPDKPEEPTYWDFLYFSFTIAVACQTADVAVGDGSTRKTVLAQSVLAFLFNMSVLGLSINVAAGLLG